MSGLSRISSCLRALRWRRVAARLLGCCTTIPLFLLGSASGAWAQTPTTLTPAPAMTVAPSWGGAPGWDKVQELLNFAAEAAFVCCLLMVLIGGAAMAISRATGSGAAGNRGVGLILAGGGGVLVIRFAPAIVNWLRN
ncbi:hypothetical protein [Candidatus Protofrankia californiensis]|uniref:hypothetical protein n=1 Tax=Candidatus Protofrankia californiensis TaxID=1839754 RepID=UPI001040FD5B|nr:hypothetical protein [Candidatus Protofrankia californiensis]